MIILMLNEILNKDHFDIFSKLAIKRGSQRQQSQGDPQSIDRPLSSDGIGMRYEIILLMFTIHQGISRWD